MSNDQLQFSCAIEGIANLPREQLDALPTEKRCAGVGTFGLVYRKLWSGREVAVKFFRTDLNTCPSLQELEIAARFNHENIVRILAAGPSLPTAIDYIVFEWADSGTLISVLYDSKTVEYTLAHCISWLKQAACGADYLHTSFSPPIIHRDIKPANLLLFNGGLSLKLGDFGTAKQLDLTNTRQVGTQIYMAPEIMEPRFVSRGGKPTYNEKCDVYSLTLTFWELLARQLPFRRTNNPAVQSPFWRVAGKRLPLFKGCPQELLSFIQSGWAQSADSRPSMRDILRFTSYVLKKVFQPGAATLPINLVPSKPKFAPSSTASYSSECTSEASTLLMSYPQICVPTEDRTRFMEELEEGCQNLEPLPDDEESLNLSVEHEAQLECYFQWSYMLERVADTFQRTLNGYVCGHDQDDGEGSLRDRIQRYCEAKAHARQLESALRSKN